MSKILNKIYEPKKIAQQKLLMTKLKKIKTNQLVLPKTNNLPFKIFKPNNFVFTCKGLTLHTHKNNNNNKRILQKKIIIKENLCQ